MLRLGRQAPALLFGLALLLRLAAVWAASDAELIKDELAYVERAEALLDGEGYVGSYQSWVRHEGWRISGMPQYPGAYQAPGYPTFVAAVMAVSGRSLMAVRIVQCLLGALSCVLLFALGRRWFGERVAWIAGLTFAFYPNLIAFTHLLWSETLFIFELLGLLWLLFGGARSAGNGTAGLASPGRAAVSGLAIGVAALTRGTFVYFAPFLVVWMILVAAAPAGRGSRLASLPWRTGLARGALMLAAAAAVIAPWTIRNYRVHAGFVLIDTNGPYNLWRGNSPGALLPHRDARFPRYSAPFDSLPLHPVGNLNARILIDDLVAHAGGALPSDREVMAYASAVSWAYISEDPERFLRNGITKLVDMWNPTSFLIRHFEMGAYGEVPRALRSTVTTAAALSYLLVMGFAVYGFGLAPGDRRLWGIAALTLYFSAISFVAFGLTRFRLPLLPLLMLPAACGLSHLLGAQPAGKGAADPGGADARSRETQPG